MRLPLSATFERAASWQQQVAAIASLFASNILTVCCRIVSLRGFPPIPTLEKLILKGNPLETHELYRPMCLLAVGHSLLRLDDEGIQLDTREAAYVIIYNMSV